MNQVPGVTNLSVRDEGAILIQAVKITTANEKLVSAGNVHRQNGSFRAFIEVDRWRVLCY